MSKPKVFVTRIIPEKGLEMIRDSCDVDLWQEELPPSRAELLQRVQGVDGLLCLLTLWVLVREGPRGFLAQLSQGGEPHVHPEPSAPGAAHDHDHDHDGATRCRDAH